MKTILVPLDFSDVTPAIVETAKKMALMFNSRIVLLHVICCEGAVTPNLMPVAIITTVDTRKVQKKLDEVKAGLLGVSPQVDTVLIDSGTPMSNILAEAEKLHADLIVIGSHGHGSFYNLLVGSTTAEVVKSAKCPVLVVPDPRRAMCAAA
jgi:nucleotide-binding universal stress UspA family protein